MKSIVFASAICGAAAFVSPSTSGRVNTAVHETKVSDVVVSLYLKRHSLFVHATSLCT